MIKCGNILVSERQDCDTDVLKDLLLQSNTPDSDPYKPDPQISVQFVQKGQYRIFNRTSVPFIYFEVLVLLHQFRNSQEMRTLQFSP